MNILLKHPEVKYSRLDMFRKYQYTYKLFKQMKTKILKCLNPISNYLCRDVYKVNLGTSPQPEVTSEHANADYK